MEDRSMPKDVPYIVFESVTARAERTIKRLIIGLVIAVIMIVASNLAWLYVWQMYDYSDQTVTVDSEDGGNANYIGHDGVVSNGESSGAQAVKTEEKRESPKGKDKK